MYPDEQLLLCGWFHMAARKIPGPRVGAVHGSKAQKRRAIVTFLMVFLIQRAQNKEALALHLKLNELVAAMEGASNRLIDAEDLSEEELKILHDHYERLTAIASRDEELSESHSVEEAEERHQRKTRTRPGKAHA